MSASKVHAFFVTIFFKNVAAAQKCAQKCGISKVIKGRTKYKGDTPNGQVTQQEQLIPKLSKVKTKR